MKRARFSLILFILVFGCLLGSQIEAAEQPLTPQETWVLKQVSAGQEADLKKQFGEKEEDRHLSARFLEDLLTGNYKVHRKGVRIKNAVITEPLDLEMALIPNEVELTDCHFQKR